MNAGCFWRAKSSGLVFCAVRYIQCIRSLPSLPRLRINTKVDEMALGSGAWGRVKWLRYELLRQQYVDRLLTVDKWLWCSVSAMIKARPSSWCLVKMACYLVLT